MSIYTFGRSGGETAVKCPVNACPINGRAAPYMLMRVTEREITKSVSLVQEQNRSVTCW